MTDTLIAPDALANTHTCAVPAAPTPTLLESYRTKLEHRRGKTWRKDLLKALLGGKHSPFDPAEAGMWTDWEKNPSEGEIASMPVYRYLMRKFAHFSFSVSVVEGHLQFDNYPTLGGTRVSIAELVLYPVTNFDGRTNRAEERAANKERRSARRGPQSSRLTRHGQQNC